MTHTTGHIVAHFVTQVPAAHGVEWSSWVAAGAAVVQAIGAVAAIWYSGKLARDAAAREIAADAAAERRIAAEAAAGAEQRRLDRDAENQRRHRQSVEDHNLPITLAIELGEAALKEISEASAENAEAVRRGEHDLRSNPTGPLQSLAFERLPNQIERVNDASAAAAIDVLRVAVSPYSPFAQQPPMGWVSIFAQKSAAVDEALVKLRGRLRQA